MNPADVTRSGDGDVRFIPEEILARLVLELEGHEAIRQRTLHVLKRLPVTVQRDFVDDSRFRIAMENFVPGRGWTLWMAAPGPIGAGSRCVVLRPRLATSSEAFAYYVIAHEFAHAHLWNGGWGEITDVEEAADALAASWGFRRPDSWQ
jgi:hypothetical protein